MTRSPKQFTALEKAVLQSICETHTFDQTALETQLSSASIRNRENTGAGFYTSFDVDRTTSDAIAARYRTGPNMTIEGLQHGMGFLLWLDQGYASTLEAHSYSESTVGIDLETVRFEIKIG